MERKKIYYSWLGLIILGVIWGGSFILMKYGLRSFNYWQVSGIRMFSAFLFLLPFSIKYLSKLNKKNIIYILMVSFIGNFIPAILFPLGQMKVDSNIAGILNSMTPIFALLLGFLFFKLKTNLSQIFGIIIGLLGAIIILTKDNLFVFGAIDIYALYIILATVCYAININQVNKFLRALRGIEIAALSFLFIGPVGGTILLMGDYSQAIISETMLFDLMCIIILGLFASAIAVIIINIIILAEGVMFASSVTYIIPVFAIMWGVLDGENINLIQIIATIIIFLGVYLTKKNNYTLK